MKNSLLKKLTVLLSVALVAVLLAGCAKKPAEATPSVAPAATEAPAADAATDAPAAPAN